MSEFVNPNIPAVVDGATVTLDPLWIDGGPGNPQPTFDVNDPTMWLPLTVMSGLASGYCERRAVVSSGFKVAAGAAASTTVNWYEATDEQKAAIVSACANNMALGRTMTSMFYSAGADANGQLIGSATGGSDYMTRMDSAITGLITGNASASVFCRADGSRYSTASNNAASTFSALAADAKTRADSYYAGQASASISAPVRFGGSSLKTEGYPGLPMEWALERKWMLDELKYTAGAASGTLSQPIAMYAHGYQNRAGVQATGPVASVFSSAVQVAESSYQPITFANTAVCGIRVERISSDNYKYDDCFVPYGIVADYQSNAQVPTIGTTVTTYLIGGGGSTWVNEMPPFMVAGGSMTFLGQGQYNLVIPASRTSSYRLLSGATATITGGASASIALLDVASGAVAYIDNNITSVGAYNIDPNGSVVFLDGGTVPVYVDGETYTLPVEGIAGGAVTYRPTEPIPNQIGEAPVYYYQTTGTLQPSVVQSMGVVIGGTVNTDLNLPDADPAIQIRSAGCLDVTRGHRIYYATVLSGGSCQITSGYVGTLIIAPGGKATIKECTEHTNVHIWSGGTLTVESTGRVGTLWLEEGAKINITGYSVGTDNKLYCSDGSLSVTNMYIDLFNPIQWSAGITLGGNTHTVLGAGASAALIYGTTAAVAKSDIINAASFVDVANYTNTAYGITKVGATTLCSGYAFCDYVQSCTATYGYYIAAYYGGLPELGALSHYTSFRVRQFFNDPGLVPVPNTTTT